MCGECMKELAPKRDRTCYDNGIYLVNWNGCKNCASREIPVSVFVSDMNDEPDSDAEDEEEEVIFRHECADCHHVIAEHYYKYWIQNGFHEYLMDCVLCGRGVDSRKIEAYVAETYSNSDGEKHIPTVQPIPIFKNLANTMNHVENDSSSCDDGEWD